MKRPRQFFFALLLAAACTRAPQLQLVAPPAGRTLESFAATAPKAMVVTPNPEATQIGLDVLKKGGNAADAAVAVSFALSVLRPQSTGIGGGGFLLYYNPKEKKTTALDFREFAPSRATRDMYIQKGKANPDLSLNGALAVAVPRLVAGLGYIYEHFASQKIPWNELVEPAAILAEQGFALYPHLAETLQERKEILAHFPTSAAIFLPKGQPQAAGEKLVQKDLAKTLKTLAHGGWQQFYSGEIAAMMVATVRRYGGVLSMDDLQFVSPNILTPVEGTYRGYKIVSMPPPSSGGVALIETLNILERFPIRRRGPYHLETLHVTTEAMKRAFLDRATFLGDPLFVKVPLKGLVSKDYAKSLADSIPKKKATPSSQLSPHPLGNRESDSTTHFSIVDREGNAVASTQTINYYFGSGLVAQGTGIVLNDEMDDFSIQPGVPNAYGLVGNEANAIAPGKVPLSSMTPTLVFDANGQLNMILGSPGGPRIITAVLHTLLNRIDFKAPPLQAVAAKRYHHQWLPDELQFEAELLSPQQIEFLKGMGHKPTPVTPSWLVMLIAKTREGWTGVADPRGTGVARGF